MGGSGSTGDDTNRVEVLAMVTIFVSMCIHFIVHAAERSVAKHRHLTLMLQNAYRELMILGFVSFGFFLVENSSDSISSSDDVHLFEDVHFLIFYVVLGFTVLSFSLMALSQYISSRWFELEKQDSTEYIRIQQRFIELRDKGASMSRLYRACNLVWSFQYQTVSEQIAFHHMRLQFIHSNHLNSSFSFAMYLTKCEKHVFLKLTSLHPSMWVFLICILTLDFVQRNFIFAWDTSDDYLQVMYLIISVLLITGMLVIYFKNRFIFNSIMSSDMIQFDPIAAHYYYHHVHDPNLQQLPTFEDTKRLHSNLSKTIATLNAGPGPLDLMVREAEAYRASLEQDKNFRISHWGGVRRSQSRVKEAIKHSVVEMGALDQSAARTSTITNVVLADENQLDLFWFSSESFMLHLIQTLCISIVFFFAMLVQNGIPGSHVVIDVLVLVSVILLICCVTYFLPLTMSLYTVVLHIGQLVDFEVVLDAIERAVADAEIGVSDTDETDIPESPTMAREATLKQMTGPSRYQYLSTIVLFGPFGANLTMTLLVIHSLLLAMLSVEEWRDSAQVYFEAGLLVVAVVLVLEVYVKVAIIMYSGQAGVLGDNRGVTRWTYLDMFIVTFNLVFWSLMLKLGDSHSPRYYALGILVLLRLVSSLSNTRIHKVFLEDVDKQYAMEASVIKDDYKEMRLDAMGVINE